MKKLILKKEVIAQLNNRQMGNIHGGEGLKSAAYYIALLTNPAGVGTDVAFDACKNDGNGGGGNKPISAGPEDPICKSILACDALSNFICPSPPPPATTSIPYINCGG